MSPSVEFPPGSKDVADSYRENHPDYICSDDDRRLRTVTFTSDVPERVIEDARRDAADAAGEKDGGAGQVPLTDSEKSDIDFSKPRANVPHARSVKGIAADEGVDDWLAHYDPTLTVDEHREVMEKAGRQGGGKRMDSEDSTVERAGAAARTAQSEECDHARGHCENGDPDACEFLKDGCEFSDDEIQAILSDFEADESEDTEFTGEQWGALKRAWNGYVAAIATLSDMLPTAIRQWEYAQESARAINDIRADAGQEPEHFDRLEEIQADLADWVRKVRADCEECHADHSEHDHDVTTGDREDMRELATVGAPETPVGVGEVLEMDDQRDLSGERANDQARLAGGEQGEAGQGDVKETTEENPGGIMADERDSTEETTETEQQKPDAFQVAEGGQDTL